MDKHFYHMDSTTDTGLLFQFDPDDLTEGRWDAGRAVWVDTHGSVARWLVGGDVELTEFSVSEAEEVFPGSTTSTAVQKFNEHHGADGRFSAGDGLGGTTTPLEAAHALREPDGGFTYQAGSHKTVVKGYSVSPFPEHSKVINMSKMTDAQVATALTKYEAQHAKLLSEKDNFVGGWHDPETHKAYLDIATVKQSAHDAATVALAHDQIAFFDFQTGQSVDVNRDAKSGQ